MEEEKLQWSTLHTDSRMIHDFGNGYKIVVNKEINQAFKVKDQDVIDDFDVTGMLLETYEQILVAFAKEITK